MNVQVLSIFASIWMGFALIGGLVDGQLLGGYVAGGTSTGDAAIFQQALQPDILTEQQDTGFLAGVQSWFAATVNFLTGWANMLALNFSFFTGPVGTPIGWIVRSIVGLPMVTMLLMALFGR